MLHFSKWKIGLILAVCLAGVLFAAPNLTSREHADSWPDWLPSQRINLGLDLQGGSHLLLEVDMDAVVRERLTNLVDEVRSTLRRARIGYRGLGVAGEGVSLTLRDTDRADEARRLISEIDDGLIVTTGDGGKVDIAYGEQVIAEWRTQTLEQSIEVVRRRIDEMGTREPTIQRQGDDRIIVQLPGVKDPSRVKELIGTTAKMNFRMVDTSTSVAEARRGRVPPGSELLEGTDSTGEQRFYVVRKRVLVSGDRLIDAKPSFQNNEPVVSFRFDQVGAKRFADATRDNVGRPFAIVLDGKVVSAPVIREPILGGSGVISGNFTVESANDLAVLLRAGALPAPLKILEERTVGPDLGADSIAAGETAAVTGFLLVMIFMGLSYRGFGALAAVALLLNLVLIVAALSVLQATLTLPGIAGIVLTIGMAVDANVLVFERIREELGNGRSPFSAVESGYKQALSTIIDANVTTLIAAVLLFQFGSGPVKGFAVTLAIGIVTSVFSAVTFTRLLVSVWMRRRRPKTLSI